jgi:putrescine transport system substrate-binding protein
MVCSVSAAVAGDQVLHVFNWSDYIAEDTLAKFEKETGIKVTYDVFDSNEVLEAKLLAGSSGYDVVVPSSEFLGRQIMAGVFQELDRSKLDNFKNLDPDILNVIDAIDPGNKFAVPYLHGTTGIGYNPKKVKAVLGEDAPLDSWDLVLKPENAAKLKSCGFAVLDAPTEIMPVALHYLGKDPNSTIAADYTDAALPLLQKMRPHVTYFHSSKYINDLANGDICAVIGWSGDILQARDRANEAGAGVEVGYTIPKEGCAMWFDMLAIPKDAKNVENAHKFINFLMRPEIIAGVTNYVAYPNANIPSKEFIDKGILADTAIYPSPETMKKLYTFKVLPPKTQRVITRAWTKLKTGK